jgi:hypothetical protein
VSNIFEGSVDRLLSTTRPVKGAGSILAKRVAPRLATIKPGTSNKARQIKQRKVPTQWAKDTQGILNKGVQPGKLTTAVQLIAKDKKQKDSLKGVKK